MVALGDIAQTRPRGSRADAVGIDSAVENRAWAVWSSAHARALQRGFARPGPEKFGMQALIGREIDVNMKKVVLDLWPALRQRGAQSTETFTREVYEFLRASQNAACIRVPGLNADAGASAGPRWWISDTWNDARAVKSMRFVETPRERKLTAAEAGEDRPPAPVVVSFREAQAAAAAAETAVTSPAKKKKNPDQRSLDERCAAVLEWFKTQAHPAYLVDIEAGCGFGVSGGAPVAKKLMAQGKLFRRHETAAERNGDTKGRRHYLYWPGEPVPERPGHLFRHTVPGTVRSQTQSPRRGLIERINSLKPGQIITIDQRVTSAERVELKELETAGLVVVRGKDVMLAEPETAALAPVVEPAPPALPVNPPAPDPALPVATPAPADPASLLQAFVQQALDAERAGWIAERDRLVAERDQAQSQVNDVRRALDAERVARTAAESQLTELRTAIRHLADGTRPGTGR